MAKQDKPISRDQLMAEVNKWRLKRKLPIAYHANPAEFRKNFNRVGEQMRGVK